MIPAEVLRGGFADPVFEAPHLHADCRLGAPDHGAGGREAARVADRQEGAEKIRFEHG